MKAEKMRATPERLRAEVEEFLSRSSTEIPEPHYAVLLIGGPSPDKDGTTDTLTFMGGNPHGFIKGILTLLETAKEEIPGFNEIFTRCMLERMSDSKDSKNVIRSDVIDGTEPNTRH